LTGALLASALLIVGCGERRLSMVPVSGEVTFDGGPPPAAGRISFSPNETFGDLPRRPGMAQFGTDGKFQVTSFREGDGLVPGRYRVKVSCLSGLPDITKRDSTESVSYVAPGYEPDELIVEIGSNPIVVNYDVPQRK